jgi:hypothetical protein
MNTLSIAFLVINAVALLTVSRRCASLPLLVGACYMTLGQNIEIGPFHFSVIRILIAVGMMRVIIKRERLYNGMNSLDCLIVVWASWAIISSVFHDDSTGTLVNRLGSVYNACGVYFLLRFFCQSIDDVMLWCRSTAILLIPVAVAVVLEKMTGYNLFSELGGVSEFSAIRDGGIRAQGPFAHPILSGTVGAVCLPLMIGIWKQHWKGAVIGVTSCLAMIFASHSSGPIMSALCAIGAMFMWRWRHKMRLVRWLAVLGYIGLDLVMKAPAYYLIARIDLTGGSTGWHRAALIEAALKHISEWWLAGTDFTRHWMPYSVVGAENQADITNHYLRMGVDGGLPLMLLFIATLAIGFQYVGRIIKNLEEQNQHYSFFFWSIGCSLFVHTVTCISVSYFDQSFIFLYLILAMIASALSSTSFDNKSLKSI